MTHLGLNVVELTADQRKKWTQTRSVLLWTCPAFTHILFSMLNPTQGELVAIFTDDPQVPTAATDGANLIINPGWFFKLDLGERVFVAAHEILHCILNHCVMALLWKKAGEVKYSDGSKLPYDAGLMNKALDYVINDILVSDGVGKMPAIGCWDTSIATAADASVDVYKKLYKKMKSGGGGGMPGPGEKGSGFDIILDPGAAQGKDPGKAMSDRSEAEWGAAVAAAIASAKIQGKLPASLERLLSEVLEPTVNWQDHIRAFFARKVGSGGYNWRKADKRLIQRDIYQPRRMGNGCGEIVVAIDTSGSIGQKQLDQFFGELRDILGTVRPSKVYVVWCDAMVHKVDEVDDEEQVGGLKPKGGGGTSFIPVFKWIDDNDVYPEALVYLTDGYGTFPAESPRYPVLWGDISKQVKYPWGEVVAVEIK